MQQLLPNDFCTRIELCNRFQRLLLENHELMSNLIISDEAHLHLGGAVNKQNYHFWASEQLNLSYKTPLHSAKVTVWCGVISTGILGPYKFEENYVTVTVTSERFVAMLNNFLLAELQRLGVHDHRLWF